jgi:hypothetical protein
VHQVSDWCSGAAVNFGWMREAKREEYLLWSLTDERQSSGQKGIATPLHQSLTWCIGFSP